MYLRCWGVAAPLLHRVARCGGGLWVMDEGVQRLLLPSLVLAQEGGYPHPCWGGNREQQQERGRKKALSRVPDPNLTGIGRR